MFDVYSDAAAVNNAETVIGETYAGDPTGITGHVAYAMTLAGQLLDIPTLPGGRRQGQKYERVNTYGAAINNGDVVAAWAVAAETLSHESVDDADVVAPIGGSAIDLRQFAPNWKVVMDINDDGWVGGAALDATRTMCVSTVIILP